MALFNQLMRPKTNSTANVSMADVIGGKADAAATGAVTSTDSLAAYIKQIVTAEIANAASFATIATSLSGLGRCVEKSDGAVLNNTADDLFTITGGPIFCTHIVGIVTTILSGTGNGKLQITTTVPSATVDLSASAVAIDNDAAGTSYYHVGATGVFTPVTAGVVEMDPVTVEPTQYLFPIGTIKFHSSAACTGVIKWYMYYLPLSPNSVVAAAA
jgi:hypothetical protein